MKYQLDYDSRYEEVEEMTTDYIIEEYEINLPF